MVFRWFSSPSLTIPKAPTTTGVTVALTSHNFCTCNLKSRYSVIFVMFWYPGRAISMILHSLLSLSVTTISGRRCSISLSVWIAKSQSIEHLSFSSTSSGWCENYLSSYSISDFLHRSQDTFFPSLSCLFLYWFPARREHELTTWVTLSTFSLQSLHGGGCLFMGSTYKALNFRFQLTCLQLLPPPLILHPLCFFQEFTMQCFLFPCCLPVILSLFFILPISLCS